MLQPHPLLHRRYLKLPAQSRSCRVRGETTLAHA
jgi:hypothetical protein